MLASAAAYRPSKKLGRPQAPSEDAEAIIEPGSFAVCHARGPGKAASAGRALRDAAIQIDRARGPLRGADLDEALVDWFDTDGRRFVLTKPNAVLESSRVSPLDFGNLDGVTDDGDVWV